MWSKKIYLYMYVRSAHSNWRRGRCNAALVDWEFNRVALNSSMLSRAIRSLAVLPSTVPCYLAPPAMLAVTEVSPLNPED